MSDITGSSLSKASLVDIEFSDLEIKEKVGRGGSGTVSKGQWISKNMTVAIKISMELVEKEVSYVFKIYTDNWNAFPTCMHLHCKASSEKRKASCKKRWLNCTYTYKFPKTVQLCLRIFRSFS